MKKFVVTDHAFAGTSHEERISHEVGVPLTVHQCATEEETTAAVRDADVAIVNFAPMGREQLAAMAPGATVIRYGVGVDNVDLTAADELGIAVANVPDYGVDTVADHAAAMMLPLLRRLPHYTAGIRKEGWVKPPAVGSIPALHQMTIGFLGAGRIACALADRLSPFGFSFLAYDPYANAETVCKHGITLADLDEVLASAHGISLHLPANEETHHLLNTERLGRMRQGAVVVNTSRGAVIDEQALAQALESGHLGGAGLDVFESEPLADSSPLRGLDNVFLSPHAAFYSETSLDNLQHLAAEEAGRALRGEQLRCQVNTSR